VRPPLGGVRQRESDGGQVLVGGVPVDAVAPCIGVDGDDERESAVAGNLIRPPSSSFALVFA
jgi:hypothetical protein